LNLPKLKKSNKQPTTLKLPKLKNIKSNEGAAV